MLNEINAAEAETFSLIVQNMGEAAKILDPAFQIHSFKFSSVFNEIISAYIFPLLQFVTQPF